MSLNVDLIFNFVHRNAICKNAIVVRTRDDTEEVSNGVSGGNASEIGI